MIEKTIEKNEAVRLRREGLSYREILKKVPVAKSTLSLWLRSVGLAKRQQQRLTKKRIDAMRRGWAKVHEQKLMRLEKIKNEAHQEVLNISKRDRWMVGIALYWAEGTKEKNGRSTLVQFGNSDPGMIMMFQQWLLETFNIPKNELRYELYIHVKADWERAGRWWARQLQIPFKSLRIYFKKHNSHPKRYNTGNSYNGLVRIVVPRSVHMNRRIAGWVEGICSHCRVV